MASRRTLAGAERPATRLKRFGLALCLQVSAAALLVACYAGSAWWNSVGGARRILVEEEASGFNPYDVENKACTELEPFPEWEVNGGFILDFLGVIYIFVGVAIICDDYFVSALEDIVEILGIQPDVAGATFMAAGSSAPEVAMVLLSTLVMAEPGDEGLGNVVGAAIFNSMTITGACALLSGYKVLPISPFPFARDTFYYVLAVVLLGVFVYDAKVEWWESLLLLLAYGTYILFMTQNVRIAMWLGRQGQKESKSKIGQLVSSGSRRLSQSYLEGLQERAASTPPVTPPESPAVTAIDMAYPEGADERLDLTNICLEEGVKEGGYADNYDEDEDEDEDDIDEVPCRISTAPAESVALIECVVSRAESPKKRPALTDLVDAGTQTEEEEKSGGFSCGTILVVLRFPFEILFKITMPEALENCLDGGGKKRFFIWKFVCSICWIATLTYFVLQLATRLCCVLNIPSILMGLVFLSAGTTVPDALSSILVSRQGQGDMAIANAVGSNIFNILFGIGLPWFIFSVVNGVAYTTPGLQANVMAPIFILLAYVLILPGAFIISGWKLYPKMGFFFIGMHIAFIILMILVSPLGGNPPAILLPGGPL